MNTLRMFVIGVVTTTAISTAAAAQPASSADRVVRGEFARRLQAYVDMKDAVAQTVLPLASLLDTAEIRRRTEALATVIRSARSDARQGDIFTPEMVQVGVGPHAVSKQPAATSLSYDSNSVTEPVVPPAVTRKYGK